MLSSAEAVISLGPMRSSKDISLVKFLSTSDPDVEIYRRILKYCKIRRIFTLRLIFLEN